jgi:hypothetical protein
MRALVRGKTMEEPGDKIGPVGDDPRLKEKPLSHWVVTSGTLAFLGLLFTGLWVFFETPSKPQDMAQRATAAAPFILAGGAIVTYFTVLWRVAVQKLQIAQHERENEGRELAEHGLLLDKAVGFLRADDLHSRGVGVTMLHTVLESPNRLYAAYAAETAADQIVPAFNTGGAGLAALTGVIHGTLLKARELGIGANAWRNYGFRSIDVFNELPLVLYQGMPPGELSNAVINVNRMLYALLATPDCPVWIFSKCLFRKPDGYVVFDVAGLQIHERYTQCEFDGVIVASLDTGLQTSDNIPVNFHHFRNCDFSAAEVSGIGEFSRNSFSGCSYSLRSLPRVVGMTPDAVLKYLRAAPDGQFIASL